MSDSFDNKVKTAEARQKNFIRRPLLSLSAGVFLALSFIFSPIDSTLAGEVRVALPGVPITVPVESIKEWRWKTVVRQERDFSCGSAAVATLLNYHYGRPTEETEVFRTMFENGDKATIIKKGFSLLDMKGFLKSIGYKSDGFRITLDQLMHTGVPGIMLINIKGYRHFVVVKGITPSHVLVGDPARGVKRYTREAFEAILASDIVFLIRSKAQTAKDNFNLTAEWDTSPSAPFGDATKRGSLNSVTIFLPRGNEF